MNHPDLRVVTARSERRRDALRLGFSLADAEEYADEAARLVERTLEDRRAASLARKRAKETDAMPPMPDDLRRAEEEREHLEVYYYGTMLEAAYAEDAWRADLTNDDLRREAERRARISYEAALDVYGVECDECDAHGDVVAKVIPATYHSPQETRYQRCPKCLGRGRYMPKGLRI